jgi:hypothetical protein
MSTPAAAYALAVALAFALAALAVTALAPFLVVAALSPPVACSPPPARLSYS